MRINDSHDLHCWMANNATIGNLRIDELVLPGTHDSGSYKKRPQLQLLNEITQDVSPLEQIQGGIRVLDIRVKLLDRFAPGDHRRFQLYHLTTSGRSVQQDIIDPLLEFYRSASTRKEIIILNFHQLDGFNYEIHEEFQALLAERLGQHCIPANLWQKPLIHLWMNHPGKTLVLSYNGPQNHPLIWRGVEQQWIGKDIVTAATLKQFMDEVADEPKQKGSLRSIQCAKYAFTYAPDDFSDKIDLWFESVDTHSYIQKFFIINTDWSLRSRLVANCIHASVVRAVNK